MPYQIIVDSGNPISYIERMKRGRSVDSIGERHGRLVILAMNPKGAGWVDAECDCGATKRFWLYTLRAGKTLSCGCLTLGRTRRDHGLSAKPEMRGTYCTWQHMNSRCYGESCIQFKHYGGRGIRVCDRWRNSFPDFLEDMGIRPDGHTIERINNDGDYEPGNCKWLPAKDQRKNTRRAQIVETGEGQMCLADACKKIGINLSSVNWRRKHCGQSTQEAFDYHKNRKK